MKKSLLFILLISVASVSYAQKINGTWKGMLTAANQKLEIVFHFQQEEDGKLSGKMDVPAQSAVGIPVNLHALTEDSVSLSVAAINMTYNGKLVDGVIKGKFNQFGMSFPLELRPGEVNKPNRPQEPTVTYIYGTEEVTFSNVNANAKLSGALTYPVGYNPNKKVPVVLMVTGSGSQNRDEEVFGHKPFLVIADYLAKCGIASLRYDDRGTGKSVGGDVTNATSEDFAEDADCGLQWLRKSGKFGKIGVLGHSEGGMIAFMLAADKKPDFIVSMAGPGINGDTLLAEQRNALLKLKGIPANVSVNTVRKEMSMQQQKPWLQFFVDYNPESDLKQITIPVMAINGSYDAQVISESNLGNIRRLLNDKNAKNLIKEYPGLNHLFQHCKPETAVDYYNIEETCSEEVLKDIANWINNL